MYFLVLLLLVFCKNLFGTEFCIRDLTFFMCFRLFSVLESCLSVADTRSLCTRRRRAIAVHLYLGLGCHYVAHLGTTSFGSSFMSATDVANVGSSFNLLLAHQLRSSRV